MRTILLVLVLTIFVAGQNSDSVRLTFKDTTLPFGIKTFVVEEEPEVSLVLSGGGARGLSQIGVLDALLSQEIPVSQIIGTSMGSIVGGLASAGYSITDLDSIVRAADWQEILFEGESERNELFVEQKLVRDKAFLTLRLDGLNPVLPTAINSGLRVSNFLTLLALNAPIKSDNNFSYLRYDYKAVCTDLVNGKVIVLDKGPLSTAMRASSSVSLLLDPVTVDSMVLVDGGLVANVPVSVAKETEPDYIIASNATSPLHDVQALKSPWLLADQLVSIPMRILNEQQLEQADIVITPFLGNSVNNDFSQSSLYIDEGFLAAMTDIEKIKAGVKSSFVKKYKHKNFTISNFRFKCDDPVIDEYFYNKYTFSDTITSAELAYDLYKIYRKGNLKTISADITNENHTTYVNINYEYNPEIRFLTFSGFHLLTDDYVKKKLNPLLGNPYNGKTLLEALLSIIKEYRLNGYSLAEPESVTFNEKSGELKIIMTEGVVGKVTISGNNKTNLDVITRDFRITSGEPLSYNRIQNALINLRGTNLFKNLEIEVEEENKKYNINLAVQEKITSLLRLGLRIDNENFTQILLDIREENLFGTATELGGTISFGTRNRDFSVEHKANRIFDSYLSYKIKAFYNLQDINQYKDDPVTSETKFERSKDGEYRQISYGFSTAIGAQAGKFGTIFIDGRYQRDEIKNKIDYTGATYIGNILAFKLGLTIDSQNDYPFPTSGFLVKSYYETAQKIFSANFGYSKFFFDYSSYFQLNRNNNIRPRFIFGFADETLPLSQQFSLGGQKNFFGLRDYEFRGRQIMISSLEYRLKLPFRLFFDTYFKFRYDLGSIWANEEEIRFKDLRHGIGSTIALETPIGPAEFSVGRSFLLKSTLPSGKVAWGPVFFYFTIGYYY